MLIVWIFQLFLILFFQLFGLFVQGFFFSFFYSENYGSVLPSDRGCLPSFSQCLDVDQRRCHRKHHLRDGAHHIRDAATRHIACDELTSPLPNSSLHDAAAGRVTYSALRSFPTCVVPELGRHTVWQLNQSVSLFFQRRKTLAGHQTRLQRCLHTRPAELPITAFANAKSSVSEEYSCLSPQRPRNSWATI